ncbi:MAG TPA: DNA polymerase Y family protein [Sphingobium sp.]|nr:DNA polymerase Y family protein [Sphingobium sp.]
MPVGASPSESAPLVFIAKERGAFRLHALDADALAMGLTPGMPLADARARVPSLRTLPYDPASEARLLEKLADLCDRFTPMIEIAPPDGLLLDITGCAHLFGGGAALAHDALRLMHAQGMRTRAVRAVTPEAALALAQLDGTLRAGAVGDEATVRHLPLIALRAGTDALLALRRAGFVTIGDLADLPPAPLAARFGAGLVDARDRLLGRIDSRITPHRRLPPIYVEQRFAEPVAHVETMLMVLGDLLTLACEQLLERHQGGRCFLVRLYRSDGEMRVLTVETGQSVREPAGVLRLIREKIEALTDPLDPGFGFDLVRLAVPTVEPLGAAQPALDGDPARDVDITALLDRLAVRFGPGRLCRFVPRDTHIPDRASRLAPHGEKAPTAPAWEVASPDEPPLRPLILFDPPERVEAVAQVPDGPPRQFRWRGALHRIVRQEGPERIAPEWWRRPEGHAGNPGLTRDYYRVEDERGRRFWLFRHGLYERETAQPHWYVHGLFA